MNRENLISYRKNQQWINDAIERYKKQKELAYSISSVVLDGMPKAKNKSSDSFEKLLDCYDDILEKLYLKQREQNKIMNKLMEMKDEPKPYRSLLTYFYIDGLSLEETSVKINYSYQKTSSMRKIALDKFDEICLKHKSG
jgi:hypothetical protein